MKYLLCYPLLGRFEGHKSALWKGKVISQSVHKSAHTLSWIAQYTLHTLRPHSFGDSLFIHTSKYRAVQSINYKTDDSRKSHGLTISTDQERRHGSFQFGDMIASHEGIILPTVVASTIMKLHSLLYDVKSSCWPTLPAMNSVIIISSGWAVSN